MRFAFVTPRYGAEIGTGPEHACRLLAEHVRSRHDVDVLTTCARESRTWKNEYPEGADRVRGVLVRRFKVSAPPARRGPRHSDERLSSLPRSRADEIEWIRHCGPWSPGLLEFLKRQPRAYDALVFFSIWHPTSVDGLQIAPERSVLFPYLRLQPALRFSLLTEVMSSASGVGFLSESERRLLRAYTRAVPQHEEMVGIGIDPPPQQAYPRYQQDPVDALAADGSLDAGLEVDETGFESYLARRGVPFRRRHRLHGRLALYGGRMEPDSGCEEMLEYFSAYASGNEDTFLVLMGVKMMKIPEAEYMRLPGMLPERERMVAYEAADITLAPAPDDVVAQPLLESFAVGTPVLASARNPSAVDHCRRSNAGLYYATGGEFVESLRLLTRDARLRAQLGRNGREYVREHFRWDAVLGRFDRLVSRIRAR